MYIISPVCITHILRIYAVIMLNMLRPAPYLRIYYSWHKRTIYIVDTLYMRFMPYLSIHNPYVKLVYKA